MSGAPLRDLSRAGWPWILLVALLAGALVVAAIGDRGPRTTAERSRGIAETITLRKITSGVGVERTFPLHSPNVAKFEVTRRGRVRRAKLYYLRTKVGKEARIKERRK